MENASKALIMAGGILIAILVIGALMLMFNQIGSYEKAQTSNVKNSQLAQFNIDFERYTDDNGITGADLVSLANKIIDYNKKTGVSNSVNYDIKMSLEVENIENFRKRFGYYSSKDALFTEDKYVIDSSKKNNDLKEALDTFNSADIELLKKVSNFYDKDNRTQSQNDIKKVLMEIDKTQYNNWSLSGTSAPTELQIQRYREYYEFKASKFIISQEPEYKDGQIQKLYFKYKE